MKVGDERKTLTVRENGCSTLRLGRKGGGRGRRREHRGKERGSKSEEEIAGREIENGEGKRTEGPTRRKVTQKTGEIQRRGRGDVENWSFSIPFPPPTPP